MRATLADVRISKDVVGQRVGADFVLVHLGTNRMFELNPTGARFWALLAEGKAREEIVAQLLEEFAVDRADLEREVDALTGALLAERLVEIEER